MLPPEYVDGTLQIIALLSSELALAVFYYAGELPVEPPEAILRTQPAIAAGAATCQRVCSPQIMAMTSRRMSCKYQLMCMCLLSQ